MWKKWNDERGERGEKSEKEREEGGKRDREKTDRIFCPFVKDARKIKAPIMPPINWDTIYKMPVKNNLSIIIEDFLRLSFLPFNQLIFPVTIMARETTGLICPPDTWAVANTNNKIAKLY